MTNKAVTIHIAPMGTPLDDGSESAAGHMWYELHDGKGGSSSYGFASEITGQAFGRGEVYTTDTEHYLNRKYMRTIEISENQYNKMTNFGENPSEFGFDDYNGISNSCVDFTWEGLAHAGLKPEVLGMTVPGSDYDGAVWPRNNVLPVTMIPGKDVPYPGEIDYMEINKIKDEKWKKERQEEIEEFFLLSQSSNLGGSQQSQLMAISLGPSFNYTSHKKDSIAGFTLIQAMENAVDTATSTLFNGHPAYQLAQTTQPTCQGDASGRGGGVKSGSIGKEVKPTSGSATIIVEGKQLVREGDRCTMNNANVAGIYTLV